jgi:hypothetical protein
MGCSCKNNQPQQPKPQTQQTVNTTKITEDTVQEVIKKTIQKYYTKK